MSSGDTPYTQKDVAEAKALLAALGFVAIETERWQRVVDAMKMCIQEAHTNSYLDAFELGELQPGDLEVQS